VKHRRWLPKSDRMYIGVRRTSAQFLVDHMKESIEKDYKEEALQGPWVANCRGQRSTQWIDEGLYISPYGESQDNPEGRIASCGIVEYIPTCLGAQNHK